LALALAKRYPLLRPECTITTSSALEQELLRGGLDLAVLVDPVGDRALRLVSLGPQPNTSAGTPAVSKRIGASPRALSRFTDITTSQPTSMYRNTVACFASAAQKPGPLCICTSVNAAAQLVAAGIGILPKRMIEAYRPSGALAAIATKPPLTVGRVYLADHVTADPDRIEAVMRVFESATANLGYFGVKRYRRMRTPVTHMAR
jgi:DNA-binding transcriptional LysR family regulator